MKQDTLNLLSEIYEHYLKTNNRTCSFSLHDKTFKQHYSENLDLLAELGYITYTSRTLGYCQVKLTVEGIEFAENEFSKPLSVPPVYQGANSIYINGSGNTISDNYNQISIDIANSDLPDDCKDLLKTFLYEIQNPHLTPDKKSDKIKAFLSEISSGTISGVASAGLTTLLTSLFDKLSF